MIEKICFSFYVLIWPITLIILFVFGSDSYCVETSKVKEIVEVRHRNSTLKLQNGSIIKGGQGKTLKVGSDVCIKYKSKKSIADIIYDYLK